jgi:hypothetical protein
MEFYIVTLVLWYSPAKFTQLITSFFCIIVNFKFHSQYVTTKFSSQLFTFETMSEQRQLEYLKMYSAGVLRAVLRISVNIPLHLAGGNDVPKRHSASTLNLSYYAWFSFSKVFHAMFCMVS